MTHQDMATPGMLPFLGRMAHHAAPLEPLVEPTLRRNRTPTAATHTVDGRHQTATMVAVTAEDLRDQSA